MGHKQRWWALEEANLGNIKDCLTIYTFRFSISHLYWWPTVLPCIRKSFYFFLVGNLLLETVKVSPEQTLSDLWDNQWCRVPFLHPQGWSSSLTVKYCKRINLYSSTGRGATCIQRGRSQLLSFMIFFFQMLMVRVVKTASIIFFLQIFLPLLASGVSSCRLL